MLHTHTHTHTTHNTHTHSTTFNLKCHFTFQEGTGARVVSACVEVIFDNSDGRLPVSIISSFLALTFLILTQRQERPLHGEATFQRRCDAFCFSFSSKFCRFTSYTFLFSRFYLSVMSQSMSHCHKICHKYSQW